MAALRLVIFEDNNDFRESLHHLFRFTKDIEVVAAFPNCNTLQHDIVALKPDVVLMDIDMPGINGIEATALLKAVAPDVQVVMLTVSEEEERIFQALRNGATGYMLKKAGPEEIVEGVRAVIQGGSPMTPAIARKVLRFFQPGEPAVVASMTPQVQNQPPENDLSTILTPREQEILEALVDGLSYKMIAAKFYISSDTVKNHIQGIYRKLHVNSKGEAISFVSKKGISKAD